MHNIFYSQRLWARTQLLDVSSAPSGSPGTAVARLRLQLESPKVAYRFFVTGPGNQDGQAMLRQALSILKKFRVPVSNDVVWGGGGQNCSSSSGWRLSTAPPPAPQRGLGDRKLVLLYWWIRWLDDSTHHPRGQTPDRGTGLADHPYHRLRETQQLRGRLTVTVGGFLLFFSSLVSLTSLSPSVSASSLSLSASPSSLPSHQALLCLVPRADPSGPVRFWLPAP